jgi:hypothetical protein
MSFIDQYSVFNGKSAISPCDDRIDGKFLADVMLGAGTEHFIREDRNVVADFQKMWRT